jgi:aminoglycoside phosphotransferase (APT) family kinase protein
MTSRISKLVVAAVLSGTLPALAAANDPGRPYDHDRDGRPGAVMPPPVYTPPVVQPPAPPEYRGEWRARHGHQLSWRERELAQVRADLARLDAERADFRAHYAYRPGQLRRFDRRYFERRAQLERRERELERVAWR